MAGSVELSRDEACAVIQISNPGKLNAIDALMWQRLAELLAELTADGDLRCLVLRGAGDEAFSSGADIGDFAERRSNSAQAIAFAEPVHRAFATLQAFPVPTLAAITGVCAGGGLELAACCDLRVCTTESRFGIPINKMGATLCHAELRPLLAAVGPNVALELLLEGRMLGADEALTKGLVTRSVAPEAFEAEIAATVRRLVSGAPLAARWHKSFVRRLQRPEPLSQAETREGFACFDTEDYRHGVRAFLDRTRPRFQGR